MKFVIVKFIILFVVVITFTSCKKDLPLQQAILQKIIFQNFNNKFILDDLKPIIFYDQWAKNKTKNVKHGSGEILIIPPAPSFDTIVYSLDFFDELKEIGVLTINESKEFKKKIRFQEYNKLRKVNQDLLSKYGIITSGDLKKEMLDHYHLSEPMINKEMNLVVLSVDENKVGSSKGMRYVFQLIDGIWVKKYEKLYRIN